MKFKDYIKVLLRHGEYEKYVNICLLKIEDHEILMEKMLNLFDDKKTR